MQIGPGTPENYFMTSAKFQLTQIRLDQVKKEIEELERDEVLLKKKLKVIKTKLQRARKTKSVLSAEQTNNS